jgi:hypothetical protein
MKSLMQPLLAAAALVVALPLSSCASSSAAGISSRDTLYGTPTELCLAAQSAVRDLAGRLVMADCEAGVVVARVDIEGSQVQLDVSLIRSPGGDRDPRQGEYMDLSARASLPGLEDPGPQWDDRLRRIVDRYMAAVQARTGP